MTSTGVYLFEGRWWRGERQREREREREREGGKIPSRLHTVNAKPDRAGTHEPGIMT